MRKRRTRGHIIADLSANHVERQALLCGYSMERVVHDYGIDMVLYTYSQEGEIESETVKIQLKATDNLVVLKDGQTISLSVERADMEFWLREWLPVILIVYDAQADLAYWVHVQSYFREQPELVLSLIGDTVTVHFTRADTVDKAAMYRFAKIKADVLNYQRQGA